MKTEDLNKAIAAFFIAFGQSLPATLALRIQQQVSELAEQMARGGEPNVAKLTKGFGDALAQTHRPPDARH